MIKQKESKVNREQIPYSEQALIASSKAGGDTSVWTFMEGGYAGVKEAYDIAILFRIRRNGRIKREQGYQAIPTIFINGKNWK
jgi:hypothetical protein